MRVSPASRPPILLLSFSAPITPVSLPAQTVTTHKQLSVDLAWYPAPLAIPPLRVSPAPLATSPSILPARISVPAVVI